MAFFTIKPPAAGRNPNLVVCHLCGREFGSKSIGIHLKACEEKWHRDQAKLPKSQRRPMPTAPQPSSNTNNAANFNNSNDIPINPMDKEKYNEEAYNTYLEGARSACPHCGRKFLHDRLQVHLRSCKPGGYFERNCNVKEKQQIMK